MSFDYTFNEENVLKNVGIGTNNKITHHFGLFIIPIKITALYTGTKDSHAFLPALMYNFQVPNP